MLGEHSGVSFLFHVQGAEFGGFIASRFRTTYSYINRVFLFFFLYSFLFILSIFLLGADDRRNILGTRNFRIYLVQLKLDIWVILTSVIGVREMLGVSEKRHGRQVSSHLAFLQVTLHYFLIM